MRVQVRLGQFDSEETFVIVLDVNSRVIVRSSFMMEDDATLDYDRPEH